MKRLTLRQRVGRLLGQASVLGLAVLTAVGWLTLRRLEQHAVEDRLLEARSLARYLDATLSDQFRDLQRLAGRLGALDHEALVALRAFRFQSPFRSAIFLVDDRGTVRLADPEGGNPSRAPTAGTREAVTGLVGPEKRRRLALVQPVTVAGERFTLVSEMDPGSSPLADLLRSLGGESDLALYVVEASGTVILAPEPSILFRILPDAGAVGPQLVGPAPSAQPSAPCLTCAQEEGALRVLAPLRLAPWTVVLEQPRRSAFAVGRSLTLLYLGTLLVLGLLGFVLARTLSRSLVEPIADLSQQAEALRQGDLSRPIRTGGDQELQLLASTLDEARRRLSSTLGELRILNETLERRVADRTAEVQRLVRRMLHAGEEERKRIARELHDQISQMLTVIRLSLDRGRDEGRSETSIRELLARAHQELRRIIYDLRPSVLDDLGLPAALRWYAENYLERQGLEVDLAVEEELCLPSDVEISAFRIYQEIVTNILRHSGADHVSVDAYVTTEGFFLAVEDDGIGFQPDEATEGAGLLGMRERASLVGGTIEVDSEPGSGTTVKLEIPLVGEEAERSLQSSGSFSVPRLRPPEEDA